MDTLLWVFALFGLLQLLGLLWRWLHTSKSVQPQIDLLFLVKNNQENVEGLIRQLAWDFDFLGRYSLPGQVMVFDLGSRDQTLAILQRLAREIGFLHFREVSEDQVGQRLQDFDLGVLVLDLRVLPVQQALAQARHLMQRTAPKIQRRQPAGQS
jgi:hypothetical protein